MANDINEMKSRKAKTPLEKVADSEKNIILITGIGGFLGFSLSKVLAQDYVVIGLDRESECSKYPDCVSCDLSSDRSVKKAMNELRTRVGNRFASVIHLSGYYDFTGEPNPLYEEVNVNGTHRLTMAWARIANAAVGLWLLFAPLVFWTPSAAAYLNDTLVGSLVIGFAILARPMPGIGLMASKHDRPRHPARMGLQSVIVDAANTDHLPGLYRALRLPLSCRLSVGPYRQRLGSLFR